jgi:hypothetical protein
MRTPLRCVLLLILLGCAPDALAGQGSSGDGLWGSAGVARGWLRASCDICIPNRGSALTPSVRLGGRVSRRLLIGAEVNAWRRTTPDDTTVNENLWVFSAVSYWYPTLRRPLYWKVGAGAVSYRLEDETEAITATALGVQLGVGYDFPLAGRWFFSPFASAFVASWGGGFKFNGAEIDQDLSATLVQVGFAVTRR